MESLFIASESARRRGVQLNAPTTGARVDAPESFKKRDPANPFSVMSPRRSTLSVIVRTYKAAVTTACRRAGHREFRWQRSFFERVIRNEQELAKIRQYVVDNPAALSLFENHRYFG